MSGIPTIEDLLKEGTEPHVADILINTKWGELEVLEHAGQLLFPGTLMRRKPKGEVEKTEVRIRVPRQSDLRKARVMARKICTDEGLDPNLDKDLFEDTEIVCTLSLCILNAKPMATGAHEPWEPDPKLLEKKYDVFLV